MRKQFVAVLLSMMVLAPQVQSAVLGQSEIVSQVGRSSQFSAVSDAGVVSQAVSVGSAAGTSTNSAKAASQSSATSDRAATESDKGSNLSKVITLVKEKVDISDELTKFEYSEEQDTYYLNWHDAESKIWVEVVCDMEGKILSYYYGDDQPYSSLATVDYKTAKENAEAFLKKAASDYMGQLVMAPEAMPDQSDTYAYTYNWVHDGVKVFGKSVSIEVSKQTGEVVHFTGLKYDAAAKFDASSPKITMEEAQKQYLSQIGLELQYHIAGRYEQTPKSFLIYQVDNMEGSGISAVNGKVVEKYSENQKNYGIEKAMYDAGATTEASSKSADLSPAEQKAVDERKDFVAPEKVTLQAAAYFPVLADMQMTDSQLIQEGQSYKRTLTFEAKSTEQNKKNRDVDTASLTVDAVTGEVLRYYYYSSSETKAGKAWTDQQAKDFMRKIAPKQYSEVSLDTEAVEPDESNKQRYQFGRRANGILVAGDGLNIVYDNGLGQVIRYSKNWTETSFTSDKWALSKTAAVKNIGLELGYMQIAKQQYALVYNHEEKSSMIDAFSGKKVDYEGKTIEDETKCIYSDVEGNPYEEDIMNLYYSGIYLKTEKLNPNAAITQKEMLTLLAQAAGGGDEEVYTFAEQKGILNKEEGVPNRTLTKEEGIKLLVSATPYGKIAKVSSIYNYPYEDQDADELLKGYIAVAYGMDWLSKDNLLKPKSNLTKAEAMAYIYRALGALN